uniref:Glyoxalase_6 domain-containing protein n=1 Tax=Angiostrongylus cantonensis TaxID=6313 RepID=A0A0K0DAJ4_ANGCA
MFFTVAECLIAEEEKKILGGNGLTTALYKKVLSCEILDPSGSLMCCIRPDEDTKAHIATTTTCGPSTRIIAL